MIVAGADEAGRGPVFGPLVICATSFSEEDEKSLCLEGIKDSKQLTAKKREEFLGRIKEVAIDFEVVVIPARAIDTYLRRGTNLNEVEVLGFAKALNALIGKIPGIEKVFLDAADVNPKRFESNISCKLQKKVELVAKHKGDGLFTCVGAASIIAKTRRDEIITQLQGVYGDIGSGYPSDPKTRAFLKAYHVSNGCFPPETRTTWATVESLKKEMGILPRGQTRLF